jgi:hypothetical protein
MNTWPKDELNKIAGTDDLHISPFRDDGKTYGTPTWIWSVVVDGALYVRAYNGHKSQWYQAALRQKAGRISAAGITKDVSFEPVEGVILEPIDNASGEVQEQRVSRRNDRYACTRRDSQHRPASEQELKTRRKRCRM